MEAAPSSPAWSAAVRTALRVLAFRATREELLALGYRHLAIGLLCTWIVGMGRWWDSPDAHLLQHLGVGSVVYVFVLATVLWGVTKAMRPEGGSYRLLLIYITLCAPPGIIYAIPVEQFMNAHDSISANSLFLFLVASWRVALWIVWIWKVAGLRGVAFFVTLLLPVDWICTAVGLAHAEGAIAAGMSGVDADSPYAHPLFKTVEAIVMISILLFIPLTIAGIAVAIHRRFHRRPID